MSPNEQDLIFEWSRRIGGDPQHGHNELHMLRQIARVRGHETVANMSELDALRAIAASYGKSNVGYMNELDALRAIVEGMGATPSNRNLHDMNEIDCLWAIIRAGGGAASGDADATDYFARVVAAGGTISTPTRTAVNAFVVSAKANGYWSKLTRINLFCGDQLAAALVPLKVGGGNATDTNNNFVGGDYSEATGLTGNGTTKYLDTGIQVVNVLSGDNHFSFCGDGLETSGTVNTMGGFGAGTNPGYVLSSFIAVTGRRFYADNDGTAGGAAQAAIATGLLTSGHILGNQSTVSSTKLYQNGVEIAANTSTVGAMVGTITIFVFAANNNGSASAPCSSAGRAYSIGSALTTGNITSYNTDLEAFQDALGRGVQ